MPKLSAFTPLGLLRLSAAPSDARRIYESKVAALGGDGLNFAIHAGTRTDARLYAESMMRALARAKLRRAGDQDKPGRVVEGLEDREAEYGLVPAATDAVPQRKAALAARMLLPGGAGLVNVSNALQRLLGDNFIILRTTKPGERTIWPSALGDNPQNLQLPEVRRAVLRLRAPIFRDLGSMQSVAVDELDPSPSGLLYGDHMVVEPEILGRTEAVVVSSLVATATPTVKTLTAVFNQAHEAGAILTSQPFPIWISSQRQALIIVKSAAAVDPEIRRRIHQLMQRLARGVSRWAIVAATTPTTAGPMLIGVSPLGATPIGQVIFP